MTSVIALAQIDVTVGDLLGNLNKIVESAEKAYQQGATILLTPELSISGYPPEDLLLRADFFQDCEKVLFNLCEKTAHLSGLHILVGHPYYCLSDNCSPTNTNDEKSILYNQAPFNRFNTVSIIVNGNVIAKYFKQILPNHAVFDEKRYFDYGLMPCVITINQKQYGLLICEDVWNFKCCEATIAAGAEILLVMNASPFHLGKFDERLEVVSRHAKQLARPIVYLNLVGAQDELVFDGSSFVVNQDGELIFRMQQFAEICEYFDCKQFNKVAQEIIPYECDEAQVYQALVLGLRGYIKKNNFQSAVIGLSGGVDSALVLALASDAIGSDYVHAVMMPSPYTAEISLIDAEDLRQRANIKQYDILPIHNLMKEFDQSLNKLFLNYAIDLTEENIQSRIRATLLMAISNKLGGLLLTTGNKSELAVGYCTLYGDMAGAFAPIKDVSKTMVYRLCHFRNHSNAFVTKNIIPDRILTRGPSAELRADQLDKDSLPAYSILDKIISCYVEQGLSSIELIQLGYEKKDVNQVLSLIKRSEFKRRQAPLGVKITRRAFGKDWRYPLTSKYIVHE